MRFRIRWRGPSFTFEWADDNPDTYQVEELEQADTEIGGGSGHNFERSWDECPEDRVSGFGFT